MSFLGDPGEKFLCGELGIGTKEEKRSKRRNVGEHSGGNKRFRGDTNGSEERMPEESRVPLAPFEFSSAKSPRRLSSMGQVPEHDQHK